MKRKQNDGLSWMNVIVPDDAKGPNAKKNIPFRCAQLKIVRDGIGGITYVKVIGGKRDGLEVFPAYGVSVRKRAPKGRQDSDMPEQGRLC